MKPAVVIVITGTLAALAVVMPSVLPVAVIVSAGALAVVGIVVPSLLSPFPIVISPPLASVAIVVPSSAEIDSYLWVNEMGFGWVDDDGAIWSL